MSEKLTPGQVLELSNQAKFLLEHPMFKRAMDGVHAAIIKRIEDCPLEDINAAEDLRKCLRLLKDVKANIEAYASHGKIVAFQLEQERREAERRKGGLISNFFR